MTAFDFCKTFKILTGHEPFPWQEELYRRFASERTDSIPNAISLPTGLGKTSVIAIWLISLARHPGRMPRRLAYVVNRRTVVDQTTNEVENLRRNLKSSAELEDLQRQLGPLAISTLRGQFADNNEWSADPSTPAVICGTVDMIGSRLLFSGYRIGYKAKPLHAGFLGQDTLIVHDEAHLEPAFQHLIETIQDQQRNGERSGDLPWPKLRVMALSATSRSVSSNPSETARPFVLSDKEKNPPPVVPSQPTKPIHVVWRRLQARKAICLEPIEDEKKLPVHLSDRALEYDSTDCAVLVFTRKVADVEKIVKSLPSNSTAQLTGTLRGLERDRLVEQPVFQRFLPESDRKTNGDAAEGTVYLVCTSAGEVGVNISADHLVCDLSTFDSMAQRFGRVNRFGDRADTQIHVVHPKTFGKPDKSGKLKISELDVRRQKTLELLEKLDGDASPKALEQIDLDKQHAAFSPEPTILPSTDILFDTWALTTIRKKMPGRPSVEPYLHGISEWDPPQTQIAWREEVGILTDELLDRYDPTELLEDYPLKPHEILRDQSTRTLAELQVLASTHPDAPCWLVDANGTILPKTLREIADPATTQKTTQRENIENKTILLAPWIGGLRDGLLCGEAESASDVADHCYEDQDRAVQRRVRIWDDETPPEGMALIRTIDTAPNSDEFDPPRDDMPNSSSGRRFWKWYVKPRYTEDTSRASTAPITWSHHTQDVVAQAKDIVESLRLPVAMQQAIILAAELHDLGKKRELWQSGIGNPNPTDWHAKSGKPSNGPRWQPHYVSSYRHEFGSLLDVLDPDHPYLSKLNGIGSEMKDLVLHLIAAHHGRARPHFPPSEAYDPVPQRDGLIAAQTIETPRRFARLQRTYGRWGLAYLESLLRAADWSASAKPTSIKGDCT